MCITGLAAVASAVGTLTSIAGTVSAAQSQASAANYNAEVANQSAIAERQRAAYEAGLIKDDQRRTIALQRAAGASSGLDISQGTPVAVMGDTRLASEMDILSRKYSGESSATGLESDADRFQSEARSSRIGGLLGGLATGVRGVSNMRRTRRR